MHNLNDFVLEFCNYMKVIPVDIIYIHLTSNLIIYSKKKNLSTQKNILVLWRHMPTQLKFLEGLFGR